MSTEDSITPSTALEWAKVIFSIIVLTLGIILLFTAIKIQPTLLTDNFNILLGWFLGILSGAAVTLGLQQVAKPKTNSK